MRRAVLLATLALPLVFGCSKLLKKGEAGGGDAQAATSASAPASAVTAPEPSAAPTESATAAPTAHHPAPAPRPEGPPDANKHCTQGKDSTACSPDGFEELTCIGGTWKVAQTCRGPNKCTGEAETLRCDIGTPQAGDACVANAPSRCTDAKTLFACTDGHWQASVCTPPSSCQPNGNKGQPGCALAPGPKGPTGPIMRLPPR